MKIDVIVCSFSFSQKSGHLRQAMPSIFFAGEASAESGTRSGHWGTISWREKIWCQEEILKKSSETVHMAICLLVLLVLYMCIYIWIWNPMEMRYSPTINGMLMFFVGVFFFWQQAAKRAKEAEQKMAQEVGNIRSGSWIIGWTQWWVSIPKLIAKALQIHVSSKTL